MSEHPSLGLPRKPHTLTLKPIPEVEAPYELVEIKQAIKEQGVDTQRLFAVLERLEARLEKAFELLDVKEEILRTNLRVLQGFEAILLREGQKK